MLFVPLIDAAGKGSWDAMRNSLHKTFYSEPPDAEKLSDIDEPPDAEKSPDIDEPPEWKDIEPPERGAFALFLDRLEELLEDHI